MTHNSKSMRSYRLLYANPLWFGMACLLFLILLLFPFTCAFAETWTKEEKQLWQAYQQDELIRLHILANSDDPADQALKLEVRDAILLAFSDTLQAQTASDFQTAQIALENALPLMQSIAEDIVHQQGDSSLSVTARVGRFVLPEKQYGHVTLPEDEYFALQIILGKGEGHNWWCVLFPQMCLMSATDEPWQENTEIQIVWDSQSIVRNWLAWKKR